MVILELEQLVDERTLNLLKKKQEQASLDKMKETELLKIILNPIKKAQKIAPDFIQNKEVSNITFFNYFINKKQYGNTETIEEKNVLSATVWEKGFHITVGEINHIFEHGSFGWIYYFEEKEDKGEKIKVTKDILRKITEFIVGQWLKHFDEAIKLP